jgi:hypothetical protein
MTEAPLPEDFPAELASILKSISGEKVRQRIAELKPGELKDAELSFKMACDVTNNHDTLISICASAFGPQSELYTDLNYGFLSSEPLMELSVKHFDVLIFNPATKHAIFVECISSTIEPAKSISDIYAAKQEVIKNKNHLERSIGDCIATMEFVCCVPAQMVNRIAGELERLLRESHLNENEFIQIWQVNIFDGQFLQLFDRYKVDIQKRFTQHADTRLTRSLGQGFSVDSSELVYKAYPLSHPLKLHIELVAYNISKNISAGKPLRELSKETIFEFYSNPLFIPHYANAEIGKKLGDQFIAQAFEFELITPVEGQPDMYQIQMESKTQKAFISNYKKAFQEAEIDKVAARRAAKRAVEEYRKAQPPLNGV